MSEEKEKSLPTSKKEPRRGKVYVNTTKGLFPISVLSKAEQTDRKSRQLDLAEAKFLADKDLMPLPFAAENLLDLKDNCAYFDACVKQIAQDVVGQGWDVVEIEEGKKGSDSDRIKAIEFLNRVNDDDGESIEKVIEKNVVDWGAIGWTAMEVSRGSDGEVNGLWHMPAHTVRVHKSKLKYAQVRGDKKRWFRKFGIETFLNEDTGKELKNASSHPANELIFKVNYWPQSEYYGAPNILPAIGSVYSLIGIRDYNLSFFKNYGVPTALVTLDGDWEENSAEQIRDFLDVEVKGTENAHRTMIMALPEGGSLTWLPLAVEVKEGSFKVYLKEMRDEVLTSYRMPPYRIGISETGNLGESTAKESTKIYAESMIGPLKKQTASTITELILKQGLNIEGWKFQWSPLDTRNLDALVVRWQILFGMSVINPDWIRKQIGLPEKEDGSGKDYYLASNYVVAGEETVEKRMASVEALIEQIGAKSNKKMAEIRNEVAAFLRGKTDG